MPQYTLKDGSNTLDRRLDRIPAFDTRSLQFLVRDKLTTEQQTLVSRMWAAPDGTPVLDQGQEGACFPPGTFVRLTDGSQKYIEDIRPLDHVVTAEGRWGRVTQVMVRKADRGLVKVNISGHLSISCTPEHPFLTQRGFVAAEQLTSTDKVAITRWSPEPDGDLSITTANLVDLRDLRGVLSGKVNTGGVITTVTPLPELIGKTPDFGRLLGLYAAEGHTCANKVVWTFNRTELSTLVAETVNLVKAVFEAEPRIQVRPNNAVNVVLYGKAWRRLFEVLVPGTSKHGDKRLSRHVTCGPAAYRKAVFDGWMAGDGHIRRTEQNGVSVCKQLALDMHAFATDLGLRPALRESAPTQNAFAATRQRRFDLTVGTGGGSNRSAAQDDNAVWRSVQSIDTWAAYDSWVYNIEVEGDHSYVADGVGVHNCCGFGVTHELLYYPVPVRQLDANFAREKVYWPAQREDPWDGGSYPDANPRYEGTSVLYAVKAAADLGYYAEYRWATSEPEMARGVGHLGPAIIGVDWYEKMFTPDSNGYIHPTGDKAGGHCCLIIGVNVDKRRTKGNEPAQAEDPTKTGYYTLHNSWGPTWGTNGNAKISRQDMAKLIADNGEVCIITRRTLPKQTTKKAEAALPRAE